MVCQKIASFSQAAPCPAGLEKARQMLEKMGWEGGGLGRTGSEGIKEPVQVEPRAKKAGLGTQAPVEVNKVCYSYSYYRLASCLYFLLFFDIHMLVLHPKYSAQYTLTLTAVDLTNF